MLARTSHQPPATIMLIRMCGVGLDTVVYSGYGPRVSLIERLCPVRAPGSSAARLLNAGPPDSFRIITCTGSARA